MSEKILWIESEFKPDVPKLQFASSDKLEKIDEEEHSFKNNNYKMKKNIEEEKTP